MLLSLLFLIILAVMSFKTKKVLLSTLVFAFLKSLSSAFHYMAETAFTLDGVILLSVAQFAVNGLLGFGIAYLVVKRAQEVKYMALTTALSMLTFVTAMVDAGLVARA